MYKPEAEQKPNMEQQDQQRPGTPEEIAVSQGERTDLRAAEGEVANKDAAELAKTRADLEKMYEGPVVAEASRQEGAMVFAGQEGEALGESSDDILRESNPEKRQKRSFSTQTLFQ